MPGHSASLHRIVAATTMIAFLALLFVGAASAGPANDAARLARDAQDGSFDHCVRAYTPGIGPVPSRPVMPFTTCVGVKEGGCEVYVSHLWVMCVYEL